MVFGLSLNSNNMRSRCVSLMLNWFDLVPLSRLNLLTGFSVNAVQLSALVIDSTIRMNLVAAAMLSSLTRLRLFSYNLRSDDLAHSMSIHVMIHDF